MMGTLYPWIKSLHVIAMVAWMAALLYLPRLYVYHTETVAKSSESERFKVMERRLLRGIATPSMLATWLFGILLVSTPGIVDWSMGWIWVKLAFVLSVTVVHGFAAKWRKDFAADANRHSARFYRVVNEVPTVALIVIVVMVIVKPF